MIVFADMIPHPECERSHPSHHRGAFHGQISHQEGGKVDFLDGVRTDQGFLA